MMAYETRHRIFVTGDLTRAVAETDPAAALLLAPAGGVIDAAEAARLGVAELEAHLDAAVPAGPGDVPPAAPDEAEPEADEEEVEEDAVVPEEAEPEAPAGAGTRGGKQVTREQVQDKALRPAAQRRVPPKAKPKGRGRQR